MNSQNESSIKSVLKMEHIIFDRVSFSRKGFHNKHTDTVNLKARKKVDRDDDGQYRVTLNVTAEKMNEYVAEVQITGYCCIDENHPQKDLLLNENAVAILFPYVRSELSLITAQPETDPIVLPAMNISAMFNNTGILKDDD